MDFIKKNFVTMLVVGATIVLAGVAVFTAMRLYNLRQSPVTPVSPEESGASNAPIAIRPSSGNWNLPQTFVASNTSQQDIKLVWNLDCWDDNFCEDSSGTETITPGQSIELGLQSICSQWQLNLNWSGTGSETGDVWDWSGVAELDASCDVGLSDVMTDEEVVATDNQTVTEEETVMVEEPQTINTEIATTACTEFTFTIATDRAIGGNTETIAPTPTPTPTVKTTPTPTATVTLTPNPVKTAAPTAAPKSLPEAGVGVPTIVGITTGAVLLLLSIALAI